MRSYVQHKLSDHQLSGGYLIWTCLSVPRLPVSNSWLIVDGNTPRLGLCLFETLLLSIFYNGDSLLNNLNGAKPVRKHDQILSILGVATSCRSYTQYIL